MNPKWWEFEWEFCLEVKKERLELLVSFYFDVCWDNPPQSQIRISCLKDDRSRKCTLNSWMSTRMAIENEDSPEGSQERIMSSVLILLSLSWYIMPYKMMLVCLEGVETSPTREWRLKIEDQGEHPYEIQEILSRWEEEAGWKRESVLWVWACLMTLWLQVNLLCCKLLLSL